MSVMFQTVLWETEVLDFHKLSRARLPMEVKYAVNFRYQTYSNFIGKEGDVIMAAYGKVECGLW